MGTDANETRIVAHIVFADNGALDTELLTKLVDNDCYAAAVLCC